MRNGDTVVYLNGLKMNGKRSPPDVETDRFIRSVINDLFCMEQNKKHKCNDNCNAVWTIAIGPEFTGRNDFYECMPT